MMSQYFKNSGWGQINGEVGVNGIDGLFIKKDKSGNIIDLLIVESKYNTSQLGSIDKNTVNQSKQMSERALLKQIKNIKENTINKMKQSNSISEKNALKKQLEQYKQIENKLKKNEYRARLFRIKPTKIKGEFKITIDSLEQKDSKDVIKKILTGPNKYKAHEKLININKKYPKNSYEWKLQQQLKHAISTETKLLKENIKLKAMLKNKKKWDRHSNKYKQYIKLIAKKKAKINLISKSQPPFMNSKNSTKPTKLLKIKIPTVLKKEKNKVLAFMSGNEFKKSNKLAKKFKFVQNIKGGDVVMMAISGGTVIYSVLKGGASFQALSAVLINKGTAKSLAGQGFSKGLVFLLPPPSQIVTIATIVGSIAIDYAIDKYIELDKRNYIGIEDLFWDVPDEVKNRITVLNLEDTKKETIFDFGDIDKETILDDDIDGETILEDNSDKKTILDY